MNAMNNKMNATEMTAIDNQIWELRGKMVGLKNITEEKMQKNTKTFEEIITTIYCEYCGTTGMDINAVELTMDFIKYIWKCTLRGFMTTEAFIEEKEHVFKHITCECDECIPEWLQVQVSEFIEDMNYLVGEIESDPMDPWNIKRENQAAWAQKSVVVEPVTVVEHVVPLKLTKTEYCALIKERLSVTETLRKPEKTVHALETIRIACDMLEMNFEGLEKFRETVLAKIDEFIGEPSLNDEQRNSLRVQRNRIEPKVMEKEDIVPGEFSMDIIKKNQSWYQMTQAKKMRRNDPLYRELETTEADPETETLDCNSYCACHLADSNGVCGDTTPKWVRKQTDKFFKHFKMERDNYLKATTFQRNASDVVESKAKIPRIEMIKSEDNLSVEDRMDHELAWRSSIPMKPLFLGETRCEISQKLSDILYDILSKMILF
jgi:hypothetical protein